MTLVEKNFYILVLKCKHSTFSCRLTKNLSLAKNVLASTFNNIQIRYLLKMLERYDPFETKVYNAQEITFTPIANGDVTVTINIDGDIYTYVGNDSVIDMNLYFANLINLNKGKYLAYANNGSLFLYSYYSLETYNDVPTITITNVDVTNTQTLLSYSITSLEDNLEKLLNLWNCITVADFCKIQKKIYNLTSC